MSNVNLLGSEEWAVVGTIDPDANGAGTVNSDIIDMSLFEQLLIVTMVGALGSGGSVAVKVQEGALANMSDAADLSGKAISTFVNPSPEGTEDDKQAIINLRGDEMTEGDRYIRIAHTVAGATCDSAVLILGKGKSGPSSDNDLASVAEIVS